MKVYYTYILSDEKHDKLYVGITNNIARRIREHKDNKSNYSRRHRIHKLVYIRRFRDVRRAIRYEKLLKNGSRAKKIRLVESTNPTWFDLTRILNSDRIENYFKHPWTYDSPHLKL